MRHAFINAKVVPSTGAAIINSCAKALATQAGVMNWGKGWNAALSFNTAKKLHAPTFDFEGIKHVWMPYDEMVKG